jgi:class 3 adenylate cyclase
MSKKILENLNLNIIQGTDTQRYLFTKSLEKENATKIPKEFSKEIKEITLLKKSSKNLDENRQNKESNSKRRASLGLGIGIPLIDEKDKKNTFFNKTCINKYKKGLHKFLDSTYVTIFMLIITLFVLFAADIKNAFLRKDVDTPFEILTTIFFGIFILEILLASWAIPDYLFSFFFWLDFISTISLIQEIPYIFDPIMGAAVGTNSSEGKGTAETIAKATSAGRITRVLRIVRIIRLIRIVKLYKSTIKARKQLALKKREKNLKIKEVTEINQNVKILSEDDKVNNKRNAEKRNKRLEYKKRLTRYFEEKDDEEIQDHQIHNFENLIGVRNNFMDNKQNNINDEDVINNYDAVPINTLVNFNKDVTEPNKLLIINSNANNDVNNIDNIKNPKNKNDEIKITNNNISSFKNINNNDIIVLKPINQSTNNIQTKNTTINLSKKPKDEKKIEDEDPDSIIKESNISKILIDSLTKKLIILILGMVLGLTLISEEFWQDDPYDYNNLIPYVIEKFRFINPEMKTYNNMDTSQGYFIHQQSGNLIFKSQPIEGKHVNYSIIHEIDESQDEKDDESLDEIVISQEEGYENDLNTIESYNYNITNNIVPEKEKNKSLYDSNEGFEIFQKDELIYLNSESMNITNYIYVGQKASINNLIDNLSYIFMRIIAFRTSENNNFPILNITYNGDLIFLNESSSDYPYREDEVKITYSHDQKIILSISDLYNTQLIGLLNMFKTLFIMVLIVAGAVVFENDTKNLVLNPLEIMIEIVEMVEKDPIIAKNAEQLQMGVKNLANKDGDDDKQNKNKNNKRLAENSEKYEVKKIQNSIVKISGLLAICYGDAGGDIIKKNLEKGKDFNPMLPGVKKNAIFGFCDIRQFPDVNDALQERTMIFVNEISEIVHSSVDRFSGSCNKNIGDAYLSAWRFIKKIETEDHFPIVKEVKRQVGNPNAEFIADQAVLGFLQVIIKINSDKEILKYKHDVDILKHRGLANYQVKMGFGLHLGWAIEGAIGSTFKIDASYLSPNVNISARLEAATKQYGVIILISGELFNQCSEDIQVICRLIDVVAVKGSIKPIQMYTIDVNLSKLPKDNKKKNPNVKKRIEKLLREKEYLHAEGKRTGNFIEYILNTPPFKRLLSPFRPKLFNDTFKDAIDNYISGDWQQSGNLLEKCMEIDPQDGPTKTIYEYIKGLNFIKPDDWKGFRALTNK